MALDPSLYAALNASIAADPVLGALPHNSDSAIQICGSYNSQAAPAYVVWKSVASVKDIQANSNFDWTRVDNLTVGKARIWEEMIALGVVNMAAANVRSGVQAAWATASDNKCRLACYQGGSRNASKAEKLFATGTGAPPDDAGVGPATMVFEGILMSQDVINAWASQSTH